MSNAHTPTMIARTMFLAGICCFASTTVAQSPLFFYQLGPAFTDPAFDQTRPVGAPSVDATGQIVYRRFLGDDRSTYFATANSISPAIIGNPAAPAPDNRVMDLSQRAPLSTNGVVYTYSGETGGQYLYRNQGGSVQSVYMPGQIINPTTGLAISNRNYADPNIVAQGSTVVANVDLRLPTPSGDQFFKTYVRFDGDQPTVLVENNVTVAPGTNQLFTSISDPVLDRLGRALFTANLPTTAATGEFISGIWSHTPSGGITPLYLARESTSDPRILSSLSVNSQGDIAFIGTNGFYVRNNSSGQLTQFTPGGLYAGSNTIDSLLINDQRATLVRITSGTTFTAFRALRLVITSPTGQSTVIAESGSPIAGYAGLVLSGSDPIGGLNNPPQTFTVDAQGSQRIKNIVFNNLGQVVFTAAYGTNQNGQAPALMAYDPTLGLLPLALVGQPLPNPLAGMAAGTTVTQIDFIGNSNTTSGYATGLNDQGVVAFRASFSDGSSRLITVQLPTPGALTTLALASLFAARRRRAR